MALKSTVIAHIVKDSLADLELAKGPTSQDWAQGYIEGKSLMQWLALWFYFSTDTCIGLEYKMFNRSLKFFNLSDPDFNGGTEQMNGMSFHAILDYGKWDRIAGRPNPLWFFTEQIKTDKDFLPTKKKESTGPIKTDST